MNDLQRAHMFTFPFSQGYLAFWKPSSPLSIDVAVAIALVVHTLLLPGSPPRALLKFSQVVATGDSYPSSALLQ
jgi:hypothetical protein